MRSKEEVRRLVEDFEQSGLTRREFCSRHRIAVTALDYWRRVYQSKPKLVEVEIEAQGPGGFALVLTNGRRIESAWQFAEAELARLIRVAEA